MSYGRRDLLQDLELPQCGGRCGPRWALEEQSQELRATQPPRWTEKGKVMEALSSCASLRQLPLRVCCQAFGGGPQAAIGDRDGTAGAQWKIVRVSRDPTTSLQLLSPPLILTICIQRAVAAASLLLPSLL